LKEKAQEKSFELDSNSLTTNPGCSQFNAERNEDIASSSTNCES